MLMPQVHVNTNNYNHRLFFFFLQIQMKAHVHARTQPHLINEGSLESCGRAVGEATAHLATHPNHALSFFYVRIQLTFDTQLMNTYIHAVHSQTHPYAPLRRRDRDLII